MCKVQVHKWLINKSEVEQENSKLKIVPLETW